MVGLRFQRCMKAEKDFVVVLFELLYGDWIANRLHAERVKGLCPHLSSAPCHELGNSVMALLQKYSKTVVGCAHF